FSAISFCCRCFCPRKVHRAGRLSAPLCFLCLPCSSLSGFFVVSLNLLFSFFYIDKQGAVRDLDTGSVHGCNHESTVTSTFGVLASSDTDTFASYEDGSNRFLNCIVKHLTSNKPR